jgi:ActR/RegA family two-component response regulator
MILIVDDDHDFQDAARASLKHDKGVLFADTAAEGLALSKAIKFSVAMVDLNLPDLDGFNLISQMHEAVPALPIVAISGVCSQAALESATNFGAVATLAKPATSEWRPLIERVRNARAE